MKNKKNRNNYNMKFIYIIIIILLCIVIIISWNIYSKMPKKECHIEYSTEKKIIDRRDILTFPYETEILCEDGVYIGEWENLNSKSIFGCMDLVNGECSGYNKVCLIKKKKEICEVI